MADGARFPLPNFQPHNQHISALFSPENPRFSSKFPRTPPTSFLPQSNAASINSVRGHVPEMFPGQNVMYNNVQRFPPQFHQNQGNLQQDKHPMAVPLPQIPRHPLPAGQLINTDRQAANSSPNSLNFPAQGQLQFLPSNTQTNMGNNIPRIENSSSAFPAASPQLLQNNSLQPASYGLVRHEHPPSRTFPAPFSGSISVPPPPLPMQFPPPLPGGVTAPMVHLAAPPVIQPLENSGPRTQETTSQEWINNFLKERGIEKQGNQTQPQGRLKVYTLFIIVNVFGTIQTWSPGVVFRHGH